MKEKLRFIPLGGTENVNQNMYLYESGGDILVVDCGIGFPDPTMLGVDKILPDFSYALKKKSQIKGILVTHGHEDHFGALPYFLAEARVPVYCTKLVGGFIRRGLRELGIKGVDLRVFNPETDRFKLGRFEVLPFRVNHSVPDSVGYLLKTPVGRIFHISDFKFDWTPVQDPPFDLARVTEEAKEEVLALVGDCLGVNEEGYTQSEKIIEETFRSIISSAPGQVLVTTISSNISRMQQAINVSLESGRKIVFAGRSVREKTQIARQLGYLTVNDQDLVDERKARKLPQEKLTYLISGSYGQPGSALWRVGYHQHRTISLKKNAVVIFSADPAPPGAKIWVNKMVDQLIKRDIKVHYYDIQENLHVSGHASRGDLARLIGVIKPEFFIPIGGTPRHIQSYKELVAETSQNSERVFDLISGQVVEFLPHQARLGERLALKEVLLAGFGEVDEEILGKRSDLATGGVVAVSLVFNRGQLDVKIRSLGFVSAKDYSQVFQKARKEVEDLVVSKKSLSDPGALRIRVRKRLEKFFSKTVGITPAVVTIIHKPNRQQRRDNKR